MSSIKKESPSSQFSDNFDNDDDLWTEQSTEKTLSSDSNEDSLDDDSFPDLWVDKTKEETKEIAKEENIKIIEDLPLSSQEIDKNISEEVNLLTKNKDEIDDKVPVLDDSQEKSTDDLYSREDKYQEKISQHISLLVEKGLLELEDKRRKLESEIEKLEKRKEKINREMRTTFAGASQDLAIRMQGFKDYIVGSLQDLAAAAEQLELSPSTTQDWDKPPFPMPEKENKSNPQFVEKSFRNETKIIRRLLDQYRSRPDYYGPPWQLRRTFEPIHAERVAEWFFSQGGRGALSSMGSRLQNILLASAIISILYQLHGDRTKVLILADTPEKLGEWRRGLQDCLGISRSDFGPNRGVVLFDTSEALIQRCDRITAQKDLPLIIMDLNDDKVSLSLLKFPLWLAFAPQQTTTTSDYF